MERSRFFRSPSQSSMFAVVWVHIRAIKTDTDLPPNIELNNRVILRQPIFARYDPRLAHPNEQEEMLRLLWTPSLNDLLWTILIPSLFLHQPALTCTNLHPVLAESHSWLNRIVFPGGFFFFANVFIQFLVFCLKSVKPTVHFYQNVFCDLFLFFLVFTLVSGFIMMDACLSTPKFAFLTGCQIIYIRLIPFSSNMDWFISSFSSF